MFLEKRTAEGTLLWSFGTSIASNEGVVPDLLFDKAVESREK
jgi:hypothetical protein